MPQQIKLGGDGERRCAQKYRVNDLCNMNRILHWCNILPVLHLLQCWAEIGERQQSHETTKIRKTPEETALTCFVSWQKCCLDQQKQHNALNWKLFGSTFHTQLQPATFDLTGCWWLCCPFLSLDLHGDCPAVKGLRLHDICEPHGLPWRWRCGHGMKYMGGWAKLTTQHGWELKLASALRATSSLTFANLGFLAISQAAHGYGCVLQHGLKQGTHQ